jgi:hypothetical protein
MKLEKARTESRKERKAKLEAILSKTAQVAKSGIPAIDQMYETAAQASAQLVIADTKVYNAKTFLDAGYFNQASDQIAEAMFALNAAHKQLEGLRS